MPYIDPDHDRALQVLGKIAERTRAGKVAWAPRSPRPYAFDVDLPSGNVEVGTVDDDGVAPFNFKIYTPGPDYELVHELGGREDLETSEQIRGLWELVKRKVAGIDFDTTLDGLLSDLDDE